MKVKTIAIIGLGRLGCSIGLAFKSQLPDLVVLGHDREREVMKQAREIGAVDRTSYSMVNVADEGDIVILAVPFSEYQETIQAIGPGLQEHAVLLDFSPLKRPVQKWIDQYLEAGHYVSMLPIMNVEHMIDLRTGPEAANADLFRGSVLCLMPSPHVEQGAVQTAEQIGRILGADPFYIDIHEFDIYAQAIGTVPGLVSAALFKTLREQTGWRDMRRMVSLPFVAATHNLGEEEELARMAFHDKKATLHWLDLLVENLVEMRRWVQDGDPETLGALLVELNIQREKWKRERAENDWHEGETPKVDNPGLMQQLFGSFGARRLQRDDES